jgi:flagellar hook-associated protein FlgK
MGLVNDAQAVAANAHIIAAAPAMCRELETVREYLLKLYDQGNSEAGQYAASIDTTLAQVEGKP